MLALESMEWSRLPDMDNRKYDFTPCVYQNCAYLPWLVENENIEIMDLQILAFIKPQAFRPPSGEESADILPVVIGDDLIILSTTYTITINLRTSTQRSQRHKEFSFAPVTGPVASGDWLYWVDIDDSCNRVNISSWKNFEQLDSASVHRKCGGFTGSVWTCSACLVKKEDIVKKEESPEPGEVQSDDSDSSSPNKYIKVEPRIVPRTTVAVPVLPGMTFFSIPQDHLEVDTVYRRVVEEAESDSDLLQLLAYRQGEFSTLQSDLEVRRLELHSARLGDQEFRLAHFRLQEMHLQAVSRLKSEVVDCLQAARIFGFEGIKVLKGDAPVSDPPFSEINAYHECQRAVVDRLLASDFQERSYAVKGYHIPKKDARSKRKDKTLASVMLRTTSARSVFQLLSKAISRVRGEKTTEDQELSLSMLSAVTKVAFDCAVPSACGAATDPERFAALLGKIRLAH